MKTLSVVPLTLLLCAFNAATPRPSLRNQFASDKMKAFAREVQRQAIHYPDSYFLEKITEKKTLAITFDDGPDSLYTQQILQILAKEKIKATFYVTGDSIGKWEKVLQRIAAAGHSIGMHGQSHRNLRELPTHEWQAEILNCQATISRATGRQPLWLRAPFGAVSDEQIEWCAARNIRIANWSVDSQDWENTKENTSKAIAERVLKYAHPGAIILLHSAGGRKKRTVFALPAIIKGLREKGYEFVTVPQLLDLPEHIILTGSSAESRK
ncbi:polysaccharide deacetylase family protein [Rhodoflexus sp.]